MDIPISTNTMKAKMLLVEKWLATQHSTPITATNIDKSDPAAIKKLLNYKIDKSNPNAIRDFWGKRGGAGGRVRGAGEQPNGIQRAALVAEATENAGEKWLRKMQDAAWEKEVREREEVLESKEPERDCCQCGMEVVVCEEIVAPVCLGCYHVVCDEKCAVSKTA